MRRLIPAALLTMSFACPLTAHAGEEVHDSPFAGLPLPMLMHNMQYYAHKLGLSVDAGNRDLQGLYIHELEEVIEALGNVGEFDGADIPKLLGATLKPAFLALESAIGDGEPGQIDTAYNRLLETCNACHRGAGRPYVVIERNRNNSYPQRFAP